LDITADPGNLVLNGTLLTNLENVNLSQGSTGVVTIFNGAGVSVTNSSANASNVSLGQGGQAFIGSTNNDIVTSDAIGAGGNDTITTGGGVDNIIVGRGVDRIDAGDGNDFVSMGSNAEAALTSADTVIGGAGTDTLTLGNALGNGNDSGAGNDLDNVTGFESLVITNTTNTSVYNTLDSLVAASFSLAVNMTGAGAGVNFNGAAETNGFFGMQGSAFNDTLTGGNGDDFIRGNGGADTLDGRGGSDNFFVIGSFIGSMDTIVNVEAGQDRIIAGGLTSNLTALNIASSTAGGLLASINTAIAGLAPGAGAWDDIGDALLLTVASGSGAGTYLLFNENANSTFDAAADHIVAIGGISGVLAPTDLF
jgi:Ca2+-binding RTX toxin-like protein